MTTPEHSPWRVLRVFRKAIEWITGPWTWKNLAGWVIIIILLFFVKGCIMDQYTIPTGSMDPTLHGDPRLFHGDRVLVNKWRFGPRIPFTTRRLAIWDTPQRWDIVVFRSLEEETDQPVLIKRVVALPGERVRIRDGKIYINGELCEAPEPLQSTLYYYTDLKFTETEKRRQFLRVAKNNRSIPILNPYNEPVKVFYAEMKRLHEQVSHIDIDGLSDEEVLALCEDVAPEAITLIDDIYEFSQPLMPYGCQDDDEHSLVPEGHYFMLGDNSAASLDGRMYGWVPHNHLYGSAFAVWWPWSRRQDFTGFSRTWWGMSLLYGIPALIILWELSGYFRKSSVKEKNDEGKS
ncbi:MAG: signal peptidase I [Candidatus Hydrogenedens sp.]|nr:signal peptidase I [Candidatus Hydrogenedens sp.]